MRRSAGITLAILLLATPAAAKPMLLEIWINGRNTHVVAHVEDRDGAFDVRNADLSDAGLAVARDGSTMLDAHSAIRAKEDAENQRLLLDVDPSRLVRATYDLRPSYAENLTPAGSGAMLRYDVAGTVNDASRFHATSSAGATLDLTLFRGNARLTVTGFADTGLLSNAARLDTALEFDDPSAAQKLVFGDAITGVPQWSRAVRFGGIQWASDFSQQPGRVTFPLPAFFGLAAVPSTVDVFVGASHVFDAPVNEGPFALTDLPILTGGGDATVVVRDALGRETQQTISLYTNPTLLAKGLTAYSFDAGFLRRRYGFSSADYARPFASASWQHGFDRFTTELHGEFAQALALMGGGLGFNVGNFGLLSLDAAYSTGRGVAGALGSADFAARFGALSLFGNVSATSGHFGDLASLSGEAFPDLRYQVGASLGMDDDGSLSLGWVGERARDAPDSNIATASYFLSLKNGMQFGLTGFRDLIAHSWAGQMFVSVPFGSALASASASAGSGRPSFQASYSDPANPDGGFGYRVSAQTGLLHQAEIDATAIGDSGEVDAAAALSDGKVALRGDVTGGIVWLDGNLYATRAPGDAVALVEAGAPDVRIYRENRPVARSDSDGNALLAGLDAFTPNRIAVEPRDYPMDADVAQSERIVTPARDVGIVVDLAPIARHAAVVVIQMPDGSFPPLGARVDVEGSTTPLLIGRAGEVFFGDLDREARATVRMPSGDCVARVIPAPHRTGHIARSGPFICKTSTDAH